MDSPSHVAGTDTAGSEQAPLGGGLPRILVMRYRFIGDTILMIPFLRNLRRAYPKARIDVLVAPNSGEVLTYCPYVDELIEYDTTRKHRYENSVEKPKSFWYYVKLLREREYDKVYVLKRSFSSALLAWLANIPKRIGFDTEYRGWLLTRMVPYTQAAHEVQCYLDVLRADWIPVYDTHLEAWWSETETAKAAELMTTVPTGCKNILLHATSSHPGKQWPLEKVAKLANWLVATHNANLHVIGTTEDSKVYEKLDGLLEPATREKFFNWCGKTTLLESLALLKHMDLVTGVDSGTLHMAASVKVPVVALFGPMDERKWVPPGEGNKIVAETVPCRPCNLKVPCRYEYRCMTDLSVQMVQAACQMVLEPA